MQMIPQEFWRHAPQGMDMFNDLSAALDYWLYEMYTNEVSIE